MIDVAEKAKAGEWQQMVRIPCECNCGIAVRLGDEGGGGQGNHLGRSFGSATLAALGTQHRSNALAQEKTGEAVVMGNLFGAPLSGDFEHCEVAAACVF